MRIALIGDSHAEAVFPALVPLLERQGYQVVYQRAERGWSEASYNKILPELTATLRARGAQAAIVTLGGNNQLLTQTEYEEAVNRFLGGLRAGGVARVWWVGPYGVNAARAPSTASRHNTTAYFQNLLFGGWLKGPVIWLDGRPFSQTGQGQDGVHFDRTAYQRFAGEIAAWVGRSASAQSSVGVGGLIAVAAVGVAALWRWLR